MKAKHSVYGHNPKVIALTGGRAEWRKCINTDANQGTRALSTSSSTVVNIFFGWVGGSSAQTGVRGASREHYYADVHYQRDPFI